MEERMQQRLGDGDDVFKIVRLYNKIPLKQIFKIETDGGEKTLEFVENIYFIQYNVLDCTFDEHEISKPSFI